MARSTTCDATGVTIPEDTPTTGIFGHQYCDSARPLAEKYLEDLHDLHTRHAVAMQAELDEMRALYREKIATLPDDAS